MRILNHVFRLSLLLIIGASLGTPAMAQAGNSSCKLVVHMSNFRNAKGDAGATLFKSADGWPENNDKAFKHGPFPIDPASKTATAAFDGIPPGIYGFAMIHDENENHKMDRNMFGYPKEGFGFANNPHVGLSAPSFQAASVDVHCPVTEINITVQYK